MSLNYAILTCCTIPSDFQTILQMKQAARADKSSHPVITDRKTDTERCDMTCPKGLSLLVTHVCNLPQATFPS